MANSGEIAEDGGAAVENARRPSRRKLDERAAKVHVLRAATIVT